MTDKLIEQTTQELQDTEFRLAYGEEIAKVDFATALIEARKAHNVTQTQLAEILGVRQPYIAKLERGEANPSIATAGRIFAALWDRLSWTPGPLSPISERGLIQKASTEPITAVEDNPNRSVIYGQLLPAVKYSIRCPQISSENFILAMKLSASANSVGFINKWTADDFYGESEDSERNLFDSQVLPVLTTT